MRNSLMLCGMLLLLLLASPGQVLAAEAHIVEKDGQIVVEYAGDPAEAKAFEEGRLKEEAAQVVEQERQQQIEAKRAAQRSATEARQAAEREAEEKN